MTIHRHMLKGCSPAPLADYLKALGIFRLVAEQEDKHARAWWEGENFCLLTKLPKDGLESFFLERYEPTPLVSPWNKGCGFFNPDDPGLVPIECSKAPRFERFRNGIKDARCLSDAISKADAVIRAIKARTKTNRSFQSKEQRSLLAGSATYGSCFQSYRSQINKPGLPPEKKLQLEEELATVQSIVSDADKPPTKAESTKLKSSAGYKRFLALAERVYKTLKEQELIPNCRRLWRGPHAEWLSAAVVLDESGNPEWPSLLGTGGNDGRLDFTNNFMQQLGTLFDVASEAGRATGVAKELLENALWIEPTSNLTGAPIGQYQPGSAGGANSSTGFASGNLVNPWDFVLMMEGSLLFSARATRRLDPNERGRASAPFAVRSHAAGFATAGSEKAQRGEQWMPLWEQPATLQDVAATYGEARVQLGRQPATRPIDMARAISRLGVARGIDAFVRYGYLERNGQSTLAVPLGRVQVQHRPRAYLIDDLAGWLDRVQRRSRDSHAPARLVQAERRLADAVLAALTHDDTPDRWESILLAAVDIEALQATGTAIDAQPIPPLRPEWIEAIARDGSAEVRLALALGSAAAGYTRGGRPIDHVRHHWLPLQPGARRFKTADKRLMHDPRVVMSGRDPIRDITALVERRLIEAAMNGQRRSRLVAAPGCGTRLDDLAQLLSGCLDLNRLFGLARAFMAIKWDQWSPDHRPRATSSFALAPDEIWPEETWLAIRLCCLPWRLTREMNIPADPRIVRLLSRSDGTRAVEIAQARLRSAGIRAPLQAGLMQTNMARHAAAALAFPINRHTALRAAAILDPSMKGLFHARS